MKRAQGHKVRGHPWVNCFGTCMALGFVGRLTITLQIYSLLGEASRSRTQLGLKHFHPDPEAKH